MGLVWNPYALPGLLAALVAFALATFIFIAASRGDRAHRRLALILLLEGVAVGMGSGVLYSVSESHLARASQAVSIVAVLLLPAAYLFFIGTLDTPIARFLNSPLGFTVIALFGLVSAATFMLNVSNFMVG
ncbi:MAG TPA: hypothetical protein VGB18_07870, partial [Candidatus Thermoplasmatota archaeon]